MTISRMPRRALTGLAATVSALALSTAPAFAGDDAHAKSISENCGVLGCVTQLHAEAWFYSDGDHWKLCDSDADGDRVDMSVGWDDSAGSHFLTLEVTGGQGACATGQRNIPEGKKVTIQVWHRNGANGSGKDIATAHGTA
ncbi:hypothetical protein ACIRQQ_16975 [Streptomyces fuscichromogenes]|uniref:hypothetical protein n=1 Tax=Streptomyces fuscichromogenes TaxID=1324013 RepID=UPI0038216FF6